MRSLAAFFMFDNAPARILRGDGSALGGSTNSDATGRDELVLTRPTPLDTTQRDATGDNSRLPRNSTTFLPDGLTLRKRNELKDNAMDRGDLLNATWREGLDTGRFSDPPHLFARFTLCSANEGE